MTDNAEEKVKEVLKGFGAFSFFEAEVVGLIDKMKEAGVEFVLVKPPKVPKWAPRINKSVPKVSKLVTLLKGI